MAKEPEWEVRNLVCPEHLCSESVELLTFIQLHGYTDGFKRLELTDDEQRAIETGIMVNPTLAEVIEGTGGIREFQCCTPTNSSGSLHLSAFYAYFPETGKVALIDIWQTEDVGEMSADERSQLKILFEEIQTLGPEGCDD